MGDNSKGIISAESYAEVVELFGRQIGVITVGAISGGFEMRILGYPPLKHVERDFTDGGDALRHAFQLASANRLSILFTPVPVDAP